MLDLAAETYGQYDVVLALGLLYHISDPYLALTNCAALARRRLLIESYCIDGIVPAELRDEPVMTFISDPVRFPMHGHVNHDRSNFWGFTSVCLQRMVEDVGFSVQRTNANNERVFIDATRAVSSERETRAPIAYGAVPAVPVAANRDDPDAWTIF